MIQVEETSITRRRLLRGAGGLGLLATIGGLAGCSSGASSDGTGSVERGPGPGGYRLDLGGYQGPELSSKQMTLRFMRQDYAPEVNAFFNRLYESFSGAYPNIEIKEELVPYGDLPTKLQVYVASGDAPDLMMGRNDFVGSYAAGKTALPLNDYFTADFLKDIHAPLRQAGSVDGTLYCVPWDTNVEVLYVNKDIFARAGVKLPPVSTHPADAWSIDEFMDVMARLTKNLRGAGHTKAWALAASAAGNGGPGSNYTQHESFWVRVMGDQTAPKNSDAYRTWAGISSDGLMSSGYLDADGAVAGMRNYQDTFNKGFTPKGVVPDQFGAGTAAISMDSFSIANYYARPKNKRKFAWGVTPWPTGVSRFGCISSDSPIIWRKTPNPDAAAALVGYLCNDKNRIKFHQLWGSVPARQSLIEQMPEYKGDAQRLAVNLIAECSPAPRTVGWFDYFNAVNPAIKDIALGADPSKTLSNTAKRIDALLKKY